MHFDESLKNRGEDLVLDHSTTLCELPLQRRLNMLRRLLHGLRPMLIVNGLHSIPVPLTLLKIIDPRQTPTTGKLPDCPFSLMDKPTRKGFRDSQTLRLERV